MAIIASIAANKEKNKRFDLFVLKSNEQVFYIIYIIASSYSKIKNNYLIKYYHVSLLKFTILIMINNNKTKKNIFEML